MIVFNPDYYFRPDEKRVFVINKGHAHQSARGWDSIIHPIHAIVFSAFQHNEPWDTVIGFLAKFLEKPKESVEAMIQPFVENPENVYVEQSCHQFRIPKNILIQSEQPVAYERIFKTEDFLFKESDYETERYLHAPLNMTFMPTNRCLTDCLYCYADKSHKMGSPLPFSRLIEIMDEAMDLGVLSFNVVGGETFCYPQWKQLLAEIKKRNFQMMRLSTKMPLSEEDIDYLKSIGINEIQVSLDSLEVATEQHIVKVDENYVNRVMQSLRWLKGKDFDVQIATVLTRFNDNLQNLEDMFRFFEEIHVDSWNLTPGFESLYKAAHSFISTRDALNNVRDFVDQIKGDTNMRINFSDTFFDREYGEVENGSRSFKGARCSGLYSHFFILPEGKVTVCEQLYWKPEFIIGDLNTQSIVEVWHSDRVKTLLNLKQKDIKSSSPCSTCEIFDSCFSHLNRCWAEILKAYGDENWDYPDPRCIRAPKMKNNLKFV